MTSRAYGARGACSPRSHYDVILIVTSFASELPMPTPLWTYECMYVCMYTDTLPRLMYKDVLHTCSTR